MSISENLVNTMIKMAQRSSHNIHSKHCATILYPDKRAQYKQYILDINKNISRGSRQTNHAEVAACAKNSKMPYRDRKRCKVFVLRSDPSGEMVMSKPCSHCRRWMYNHGYRKVIYSCGGGIFETIVLTGNDGYTVISRKIIKICTFYQKRL